MLGTGTIKSRRYSAWDKYTKIFLAVMSSSTVASWGIWDEIDLLWKRLFLLFRLSLQLSLPIIGLAEKNWRDVQLKSKMITNKQGI